MRLSHILSLVGQGIDIIWILYHKTRSEIPTNDTKDLFAAICNVVNMFSPLHVCAKCDAKLRVGIHHVKCVATKFVCCCDCGSFCKIHGVALVRIERHLQS